MVLGRGSLEGGGRKRQEDDVKSIKISGQACRAKMHINEGIFAHDNDIFKTVLCFLLLSYDHTVHYTAPVIIFLTMDWAGYIATDDDMIRELWHMRHRTTTSLNVAHLRGSKYIFPSHLPLRIHSFPSLSNDPSSPCPILPPQVSSRHFRPKKSQVYSKYI
jgi:hypothetical protein